MSTDDDNESTRKTLIGNRLAGLMPEQAKKPPEPSFRHPPRKAKPRDEHTEDLLDIPGFMRREAPKARTAGPLADDVGDFGMPRERGKQSYEYGKPVALQFTFQSAMWRLPVHLKAAPERRVLQDEDVEMLAKAMWQVLLDALSAQRIVMSEKAVIKNRTVYAALIRQMIDGGFHEQTPRHVPLMLPARDTKVVIKPLIEEEPGG